MNDLKTRLNVFYNKFIIFPEFDVDKSNKDRRNIAYSSKHKHAI